MKRKSPGSPLDPVERKTQLDARKLKAKVQERLTRIKLKKSVWSLPAEVTETLTWKIPCSKCKQIRWVELEIGPEVAVIFIASKAVRSCHPRFTSSFRYTKDAVRLVADTLKSKANIDCLPMEDDGATRHDWYGKQPWHSKQVAK